MLHGLALSRARPPPEVNKEEFSAPRIVPSHLHVALESEADAELARSRAAVDARHLSEVGVSDICAGATATENAVGMAVQQVVELDPQGQLVASVRPHREIFQGARIFVRGTRAT